MSTRYALLAVVLVATACHHHHDSNDGQGGDNDHNGDSDTPRPQLTPYACDLETTATAGPRADIVQMIPGTTTALLIGATDATDTENPFLYDYATGAITVLANGGPATHSAIAINGYSYVGADSTTNLPNTVVALLYNGDVRMPHAYLLHTDGHDAVRLGDEAYGVSAAYLTPDKSQLIGILRNATADQVSLALIDIASGAQTVLTTMDAERQPGYLLNDFHPLLTPDGSRLIYTIVEDDDNQRLMSVTTDASHTVTPLSPAKPAGYTIQVRAYGITAAGVVYYEANADDSDVNELYAIHPDGTGKITISQARVAGDDGVSAKAILVSGERIVYSYGHTGNVSELDVVGIDGTGRHRLDSAGLSFETALSFVVTPAADAVVYIDQANNLSVSLLDGSHTTLLAANAYGSYLQSAGVFADNRLVFLRSESAAQRLWAVDLDGGNALALTPSDTAADSDMQATTASGGWRVSGKYVVAQRRAQASPNFTELFAIDATNAAAVNITPAGWTAGRAFAEVATSTDGTILVIGYVSSPAQVFYKGSVTTALAPIRRCVFDAIDEYFGVASPTNSTVIASRFPQDASVPRQLISMRYDGSKYQTHAIDTSGLVSIYPLYVTADGSQFAAAVITDTGPTLYIGDADGGAVTQVTLPASALDVADPQISPDKARVAFISGDPNDLYSYLLWTTAPDGSDPHQISQTGAFIPTVLGSNYRFTNDGRVLFKATVPPCLAADAFIADADGGNLTRLTPSDCAGVNFLAATPNGFDIPLDNNTIIYETKTGVYRQTLNGDAAVLLTPASGPGSVPNAGGGPPYAQVTPDGAHVLYIAYDSGTPDYQLWTVPTAGGTAIELAGSVSTDPPRMLSPDGKYIAFIIYGDGGRGVSVAPTDGSTAAVTLIAPKLALPEIGIDVALIGLSNDTVYMQDTPGIVAAPVTGGAVQTVHAIDWIPYSRSPLFAPSADEILFYDDIQQTNVIELYSLKLADKSVSRVLPALKPAGYVGEAHFGPNGSLLVITDSGQATGELKLVEVR